MRNKKLQGQVTAGRWTLPIVVFICTLCWVLTSFLLPDLTASTVEDSTLSLWQSARDLLLPAWAERLVSYLIYAVIGYRAEQPFRHYPYAGVHADSHILSVGHYLPGNALAICRRHCSPCFPVLHLFPVQKLSAAAGSRLFILFLPFHRSGKPAFPPTHLPFGTLDIRSSPFSGTQAP